MLIYHISVSRIEHKKIAAIVAAMTHNLELNSQKKCWFMLYIFLYRSSIAMGIFCLLVRQHYNKIIILEKEMETVNLKCKMIQSNCHRYISILVCVWFRVKVYFVLPRCIVAVTPTKNWYFGLGFSGIRYDLLEIEWHYTK